MNRTDKILGGINPRDLEGIEIGPLAAPIVKKEDGSIIYVDHASRAELVEKYSLHDPVAAADIVEVDAIWGANTFREALGPTKTVDYVVASHVIEHVPDLVSWINELTDVLKESGSIRLAIPDMRYCFDFRREPTRLSDILVARFNQARSPQIREIIDSELYHLHMDLGATWAGSALKPDDPCPHELKRAFALASRAAAGEYIDVHCWTFTLSSFAKIMEQLGRLDLIRVACDFAIDTAINEHEFFVSMRPADRSTVIESWSRVYEDTVGPSSAIESWPEARLRWLANGQPWPLERYLDQIGLLKRELEELRNSRSWKYTAPIRYIVDHIKIAARLLLRRGRSRIGEARPPQS